MEYDKNWGEVLDPVTTRMIRRLVENCGLNQTLRLVPNFRLPLAEDIGSPHTQECVVKQREQLWCLFARRVRSEIDAGAQGDASLMLKVADERFHCFCYNDEHMLEGTMMVTGNIGGGSAVMIGWRKLWVWEEGEIDLDDVQAVTLKDPEDVRSEALAQWAMAELNRRNWRPPVVEEKGEGSGENNLKKRKENEDGEGSGENKKRKTEGE